MRFFATLLDYVTELADRNVVQWHDTNTHEGHGEGKCQCWLFSSQLCGLSLTSRCLACSSAAPLGSSMCWWGLVLLRSLPSR